MKLKTCVVQEDKAGCGVACLATIVQKSYSEVAKCFNVNLTKLGITNKNEIHYLSNEGLDVANLQHWAWFDRIQNNKRLAIPYADIHILSMKEFVDKGIQHALVMDETGRIFCPSDGKEMKLEDIYLITENIGIWYPKNWKFKKEKGKK